jgi:hypothetical protein
LSGRKEVGNFGKGDLIGIEVGQKLFIMTYNSSIWGMNVIKLYNPMEFKIYKN